MEKTPTFQTCPHCNGTGIDKNQMYSTTAFPTCGVCQGQKIISTVTGMPPILLVPVAPPHEDKVAEHRDCLNILELHLGSDFYKTGEFHNNISNAMQEYASNERNRAIQECIDCFNDMFLISPSDTLEVAKQMKESYNKMVKLKT